MRKNNKKALILSCLSLLLCVSMLVGATFAWFTDTAETSVNKIQAGTLDIELYKLPYASWAEYQEDADKQEKFINITEDTEPLFDYDKWEPGHTRVEHLALYNRGNLAAKVKCTMVPTGEISKLADVIDVYYAMYTQDSFSRETLFGSEHNDRRLVGTLREVLNGKEFPLYYSYLAGVSEEDPTGDGTMFSIIFKMKEEAGNDYQGLALGAFDIRIEATQAPVEYDSFSDQYDENAKYADEIEAQSKIDNDEKLAAAIGAKIDYTVEDGNYDKIVVADAVNVTINGGNFNNQIVAAGNGGTVTIKNASGRTGSSGQAVIANVTGGSTVIFEGGNYPLFNSLLAGDGTGTVEIKGGYFDGGCFYLSYMGDKPVANLTITGGTFGDNFVYMSSVMGPKISDFVPNTHQIINNTDGSCTVVAK